VEKVLESIARKSLPDPSFCTAPSIWQLAMRRICAGLGTTSVRMTVSDSMKQLVALVADERLAQTSSFWHKRRCLYRP
jgi:hypothetical protein